ncbi:MAG TPA: phospholipid carrier-dependent glycosyltransferase [Candidatus Micrarchaeia archaeon]|nr:phospholipid carrier-dependent glycosyltransferase [Candidatus Micrarchaeia archaeon]
MTAAAGVTVPMWRREWRWAAALGVVFAVADALMAWPVHPVVAFVLFLAPWGLSLLLRRHRTLTGIDGRDCWIAGAFVAAALVVRLASPIFPDIFSGHFTLAGTVPAAAGTKLTPTHEVLGFGAWGLGFPADTTGCTKAPVGPHLAERRTCGFVFDEVYFAVNGLENLKGVDYFDPEPPLTKLLISAGISWLGFDPWGWRIMPAILGSLFIGVLYMLARRLWNRDRWFAVLAAGFASLDGLALVESRTAVIDMLAGFFVALAYWAFLVHWHARTPRAWRWTLYLTAVASGLGIAAKADTIPAIAVMVVCLCGRWLWPRVALRTSASDGGVVTIGGAAATATVPTAGPPMAWRVAHAGWHHAAAGLVILFIFYLSFFRYWTTTHNLFVNYADTGLGTSTCTGLTTPSSTCNLPVALPLAKDQIGPLTIWLPTGVNLPQTVSDVVMNSVASLSYQATLTSGHPFASPFWSWPLVMHPVLFYAHYSGFGSSVVAGQTVADYAWITDMGNPVLWWLGLLGLAGCLYLVVRRRDRVAAFILLAYLFEWLLIWSWPTRVLFFYEMIGALPFMCLGLAYVCARMRRTAFRLTVGSLQFGTWSGSALTWTVALAVFAAFVYFYPLWTALPLAEPAFYQHLWLPGWS